MDVKRGPEPGTLDTFRLAADACPNVDACEREPIHIIGHIQSHGLLFAVSEPDCIVRQVSTNVEAVLGLPSQSILGRSLATVLGPKHFDAFRSEILTDDLLAANPLRVVIGKDAVEMNCIAHRQAGVLIVEFELLAQAHSLEPLNVAAHCRMPLHRMEHASDISDLAQVAATEILRLSGFERVMTYRFDEQWNGEVIAEAVRPSSVSYLGLRFPASDIPAQARRLFLLNPLRAIADVESLAVPIVPEIDPQTGVALDLTRSCLRSASPVHMEYLRNMGVRATMTVSIIVRGRLWGMIACHHGKPHAVESSTRSVCEHIGQILASQIASRIDNAALEARLTSRIMLEEYLSGTEASHSPFDGASFQGTRLLALLGADGLISHIDDVVTCHGAVVEEVSLLPIVGKLQTLASRGIASSNSLRALDSSAESYTSAASGALYVGLGEDSDDYLLLLRREIVETVTWAGNPDKAVNADAQGLLRPRKSFAAWQETVRGRSRRWTELELENASFLREQLLRLREAQRLRKSEARLREKNRLMAMAEETAHVGHWRLDLISAELFWSDEVYRTYGLAKTHQVTLENAISFYHPDDREMVETTVGRAIASGTAFAYESRIVRPDKTIRHVVARGQTECAPNGTVIAVFGVFADVTDTKNAELARERLLERIGVATQAAQVGIWEWDVVTDTMVWDPIMFALSGFAEASFAPTFEQWAASIHCDDRNRAEHEITQATLGGAAFDTEYRVVWPTGEIHHIRALAKVIFDGAGAAERMIGTNWDITEVRTLADELRREKDAATFAAAHDTLTGLFNRRGFQAWMESKPGFVATLLYLDIDDFKAVNDRGGHAAGDETLRRVARIIRDAVRESDASARIGGDEFLIALFDVTDSETIARISSRIASAVAALRPLGPGDDTRIGMSIGVGHLANAQSSSDALREADADLYRRKSERKAQARSSFMRSSLANEPGCSAGNS